MMLTVFHWLIGHGSFLYNFSRLFIFLLLKTSLLFVTCIMNIFFKSVACLFMFFMLSVVRKF